MPSELLLVARLILAGTFAVAGAAKLADRGGVRDAAVGFGAPERLAGPIAWLLPLGELGLAVALLPGESATEAALGTLLLLGVFSVAIGVSMARGTAPECRCFGQVSSSPVGWSTLARNGALGALASVVVALGWNDPGPSAVGWIADLEGESLAVALGGLGALLAIALSALVVLHVLRSHGGLLLRIEALEGALAAAGLSVDVPDEPRAGLEPGTLAPSFELPDLDGDRVTLESLIEPGRPAMLVFTDAGCGPCRELAPEVAHWQREHEDELVLALVAGGSVDDIRAEAERHGLRRVLLETDRSVSDRYEAYGTPSAVLVDRDGRIASPVAQGPSRVEGLLETALSGEVDPQGLPVGAEPPGLSLPDLRGDIQELARFHGEPTLLVFWNPSCGFCDGMRDELLALESKPPPGAPRLVVISTGDREATRSEGFRSPVLFDQDLQAGEAFGALGTPMAVLLDAEGRVAAPVAGGRDDVLRLARRSARSKDNSVTVLQLSDDRGVRATAGGT